LRKYGIEVRLPRVVEILIGATDLKRHCSKRLARHPTSHDFVDRGTCEAAEALVINNSAALASCFDAAGDQAIRG
jgi:hypothetical protein